MIIIKITAILKPCMYLCNVQCACFKLILSIIQPIPMLYCFFIWTGRHICSKLRWGPKCFDEKCRVPISFLMQYHTKIDCADVLVPKVPEAISYFTRPSNKKAERRRFFPLLKETNTRSVCYHLLIILILSRVTWSAIRCHLNVRYQWHGWLDNSRCIFSADSSFATSAIFLTPSSPAKVVSPVSEMLLMS